MAAKACCVCINGVNYTMACACNPCGGNGLSMSSVNPNPAICQSIKGNCGGASCVSNALNAVGRWGTALTGILQGKPVVTSGTGVAVGAKGATSITGPSQGMMLLILVVVIAVIFFALRK